MISVVESLGRQRLRRLWKKVALSLLVGGLWLAVVVSALAVVNVTQHSRKLVNELEVLRREQASLEVTGGQYLLEQSAWSAYSRIENLAETKLKMKVPAANDVVLVVQ